MCKQHPYFLIGHVYINITYMYMYTAIKLFLYDLNLLYHTGIYQYLK